MTSTGEYGCHDIEQLYTMVEQAVQGLESTYQQVGAWQRAQQALEEHERALRSLKAELVTHWPPEKSPASAAYLVELDRLLAAVTATGAAAGTNATVIAHAAEAITQTRDVLKPIRDEYTNNAAKIARYEQNVNIASIAVGVVSGPLAGPLAGLGAKGAAHLFTDAPVDDGRQQQLVRQAQQQMDALAVTARAVTARLQTPPEYQPPWPSRDGVRPPTGGNGGGAVRPPVVDPPAYTRAQSSSHALGLASSPAQGPATAGAHPSVPDAGAVLAGAAVASAPVPLVTSPPPATAPVPGGGYVLGAPPMPTAPNLSPLGGGVTGVGRSPAGALPPGGRIDARINPVGDGGTVPGRTPASTGRYVNPVGGVIGSDRTGVVAGMPGGHGGRRSDTPGTPGYRRDPDNPWAVAQGVPPVIESPPATQVTVEPGVIGIDR